MGPRPMPTRSSSENAVSTASFTGVSSGMVTSTTWQRSVVLEQLEHVAGLGVDRPDADGVEQAAGRLQEGDGVPGGRGVEHDQVGDARSRSSCLTLPSSRMSLMPGAAVATTSSAPEDTSRLRDARQPVVAQVLEQRGVGGERAGPHVGRAVGPAARRQHHLVVAELALAEHRGQPGLALDLDDQGRQTGEGGGSGQRGADRRLADPALPGHDDQPRCSEELFRIHSARRPPPRTGRSAGL